MNLIHFSALGFVQVYKKNVKIVLIRKKYLKLS